MAKIVPYNEVPGPGLYPDILPAVYHSWDCASRSRLKDLADGEALEAVRYDFLNPEASTDAQLLGNAVHHYVIEHDAFDQWVVCGPGVIRRGADNLKLWAKVEAEYPHAIILTGTDPDTKMATIKAIGESLMRQPRLKALLDHPDTQRELTVIFDRECIGPDGKPYMLRIRVRPDLWNATLGIMLDLKTCGRASLEGFAVEMTTQKYHYQGALYGGGVEAHDYPCKTFLFGCGETKPPHLAAVHELDPVARRHGWRKLEPAMGKMAQAYATDSWPGHPEDIQIVSLVGYEGKDAAYADAAEDAAAGKATL